jgi:glycosyltransferase involved in cell wall biosynthesis
VPRVQREKALWYLKASDLTWVIYQKPALSLNARIGLPWKLFESLACGVPALVDRDTLRAALVKRLKCGIVLEEDNPDYISRTIVSIARDLHRHRSMSTAARQASQNFVWEETSTKLIDVYSELSLKTKRG